MAYDTEYVHGGAAVETTLASDITNASTTITLGSTSGWPSPTGSQKAWGVLAPATSAEEKITYTGISGNSLTGCTRGRDGTSAAAHDAGVTVRHGPSAAEATEANYVVRETVGKITAAGDLLIADGVNSLKRLALGAANKIPKVNAGGTDLEYGLDFLDEDTMSSNSATAVPSQQSVKAYVDSGTTAVKLTKSAAQSIANNTVTALTWDTETFDAAGLHGGVNPSRITVNRTGVWAVVAAVQYATNGTGERQSRISKNGTGVHQFVAVAALGSNSTTVLAVTLVSCTAGDYLEAEAYQTSGGALDVNGGALGASSFSAWFLGGS